MHETDKDKKPSPLKTPKTAWEMFDLLLTGRTPRLLIFGPPGLGKSYTPWAVANREGWEFHSITLTDQTPMSELRGHFVLKGSDFVWHDGIIARAWRKSHSQPVILELNEIVEASADAEVFLHNALDDPEFARMDLPTGETLRPHPRNLMIVATMNGLPGHLREALRDRFPVTLEVGSPHPAAIESLPADLQDFAKEMTQASRADRISMRPIVAFAKLREQFTAEIAAKAVFGKIANDMLAIMATMNVATSEKKAK